MTRRKTTEAVIGRWPEVFEHYKLPQVTGRRHYGDECPICGSKGSFRIDNKDERGTFICKCNAGDGWKLLELTQGKDFKTLASEVDKIIGNEYIKENSENPKRDDRSSLRKWVSHKFSSLLSLKGTPAESYLNLRGIHSLPLEHIRYCDNQPANGKTYQAIYSLATDDKGALCYLHRTLLDGDKKANVDHPKKMKALQEDSYLSYANSIAIRMFPPASTLGIAEGIETALSCKQIYGVNTWSVMNANIMEKFRVPTGVKHLIIFADMDPHSATGHSAAFACAHSNLTVRNDLVKVSVRWGDNGDFNDLLINGDQVRELTFTKRVAA
ncbi:DNA primase [Limnobaculum zhutongyuii]|uniref:DNA primase n=1 Tax=Limnobaculum zhutongyuii TaxID=2498113 RepID=A0A411WRZ3_9GAMM|nr:toprim domain-containing protein [Limnobaculum zhutongyuii]QBH98775.1 DNA primase [Limnobaculum zhutongyuii]TQS88546.1 DNA primase [Limnobaculum zhutongyuii]